MNSKEKKPSLVKKIIIGFFTVIFLVILGLGLASNFYAVDRLMGKAMEPSLHNQELLLNRKIQNTSNLKRGDIITYHELSIDVDFIGRIIGIPGDEIVIKDGKVYLNNKELDEPYLAIGTTTHNWQDGFTKEGEKVTVTANNYFILKDNRDHANDSRINGFVSGEDIQSVFIKCYWNCKN